MIVLNVEVLVNVKHAKEPAMFQKVYVQPAMVQALVKRVVGMEKYLTRWVFECKGFGKCQRCGGTGRLNEGGH